MNITVKQFEKDNRNQIEYWLDHALYYPVDELVDMKYNLPTKFDATSPRNLRRFSLLRKSLRLLRHIDLTNSKRVIDIGAGFGDFALLKNYFDLEQLDATDPGKAQYNFLKTYMKDYYTNIYDLGIEDINLQGYDTAIILGFWAPNFRLALEKYVLSTDISTIIIYGSYVNRKDFTELESSRITYAGNWKYNIDAKHTFLGKNFLDLVMRGNGFRLDRCYEIRTLNKSNSKYTLQYTKNK